MQQNKFLSTSKVGFRSASILLLFILKSVLSTDAMSAKEMKTLSAQSKEMFYHAYNSYMNNAFPADELMPLSCKGRYRDHGPSLNDINDAFGNFSLTLIDSLDTLFIMGDVEELDRAIQKIVSIVSFDSDIVVTSFETNIRIVGGLISAHILAKIVQQINSSKIYDSNVLKWYKSELLDMALDIGHRLLPSFNTPTGLPYRRINLRHGIDSKDVKLIKETCTACAGSMILEFAALSRLSGQTVFEEKASKAMDVLWKSRNLKTNLVGSVINVYKGSWVKKESGIGGGIDSYYEYLAKAYLLLGERKYLDRWETHYAAIMNYVGKDPIMRDVFMDAPDTNSMPYTDALVAFWPGLQVLMGDLKPAIIYHQVLYHILRRNHFIPEAFRDNYQVHFGEYRLRPEFIESTYHLYKATKDHYYLNVGKHVLRILQKHTRVECGFAAVKDLRLLPMPKQDRMDSFFLSETLKYLYLLFTDESNLLIDINRFIFTTEGHLLPIGLEHFNATLYVNKNMISN